MAASAACLARGKGDIGEEHADDSDEIGDRPGGGRRRGAQRRRRVVGRGDRFVRAVAAAIAVHPALRQLGRANGAVLLSASHLIRGERVPGNRALSFFGLLFTGSRPPWNRRRANWAQSASRTGKCIERISRAHRPRYLHGTMSTATQSRPRPAAQPRHTRRWLARLAWAAVLALAVLVLLPYLLAPHYRFVNPVSTLI